MLKNAFFDDFISFYAHFHAPICSAKGLLMRLLEVFQQAGKFLK